MKATATYEKQKGVPYVIEKGYIPADKIHEATSIAMEYAVDDWGIAAMARKMGKTGDVYKQFSIYDTSKYETILSSSTIINK